MAVKTGGVEQGSAEGLLAGPLEGLGVGNDTLGACVGVEDGVGDLVVGTRGNHVVRVLVLVFGVEDAALAQVAGFGGVGEVWAGRAVVLLVIFGVGGELVAVVVHQLIEFVLGGHGDGEREEGGI